jgi:UV DNA damage endonuclease
MRLGLCCLFQNQPTTRWRTLQVKGYLKLPTIEERLAKIRELVHWNLENLLKVLDICSSLNIKSFRVQSDIWPLNTHPEYGYSGVDLDSELLALHSLIKNKAQQLGIRLTTHPNMIYLGSNNPVVVERSLQSLKTYTSTAHLLGQDLINIHLGGVHGSKEETIKRFRNVFLSLPLEQRELITLENDDLLYTPTDLLPICRELNIPLVYDVHHHRCNPDLFSIEEATDLAISTWDRQPLFHISSPRGGYDSKDRRPHSDYINPLDWPNYWSNLDITVDVEAKYKELALLKLREDLALYEE